MKTYEPDVEVWRNSAGDVSFQPAVEIDGVRHVYRSYFGYSGWTCRFVVADTIHNMYITEERFQDFAKAYQIAVKHVKNKSKNDWVKVYKV